VYAGAGLEGKSIHAAGGLLNWLFLAELAASVNRLPEGWRRGDLNGPASHLSKAKG
jgi:hypothetical protein